VRKEEKESGVFLETGIKEEPDPSTVADLSKLSQICLTVKLA
jgi:hypothetical protein